MASSHRDLQDLPEKVKEGFVQALSVIRLGGIPPRFKPWKGAGPGVFELLSAFRGDAFRAIYTV